MNFENIKDFSTEFPNTWSFLWSPEEANSISNEHKDQIHFLNKEATEFVRNYIYNSNMLTVQVWKPFNERYFKTIEEFDVSEVCDQEIKKWLHSKPIPFQKYVYVDYDRSGQAVTLTWKMVIKYWKGLFFGEDIIIFDETLNWGLFSFHEDKLFYGTDKIYSKEFEYEKARDLEELKSKYFNRHNLNFSKDEKRQAIKDFKEKYNTDKIE